MFIKLVRLGADAEVKFLPSGKPVCELSVAYDVGWGDNKKTQWMRLSLWGDRAEKSAQHLTKGKQIEVRVDDLHIEIFDGRSGPVSTLKGTLVSFEFTAGGRQDQASGGQQDAQAQQRERPAAQAPAPARQPQDFDDDIPF